MRKEREEAKEKRHLGVDAGKYPYTKEMSPLNEGIRLSI